MLVPANNTSLYAAATLLPPLTNWSYDQRDPLLCKANEQWRFRKRCKEGAREERASGQVIPLSFPQCGFPRSACGLVSPQDPERKSRTV